MSKRKKKKKMEITEKSLILTEDEIVTIKTFVDKVSSIPCVECVYILPLYSYLTKRAGAAVVALYTDKPSYNKLLTGVECYRSDDGEFLEEEMVDDIAYREYSNCGRLGFNTEYSEYYKYPPTNLTELSGTITLIHAIILFDRFNEKTKFQAEAIANYTIPSNLDDDNIIPIENINDLVKRCKNEGPVLRRT